MASFDVLIAGAGPAGCATALSLANFAPNLQVGLVDGSAAGHARIGEVVPPPIRPVLVHLGVWDTFVAARHCPSYRTVAAWGGSHLTSNEFVFHTQQVGWRIDRAVFDVMLIQAATSRGAVVRARTVYSANFPMRLVETARACGPRLSPIESWFEVRARPTLISRSTPPLSTPMVPQFDFCTAAEQLPHMDLG